MSHSLKFLLLAPIFHWTVIGEQNVAAYNFSPRIFVKLYDTWNKMLRISFSSSSLYRQTRFKCRVKPWTQPATVLKIVFVVPTTLTQVKMLVRDTHSLHMVWCLQEKYPFCFTYGADTCFSYGSHMDTHEQHNFHMVKNIISPR
jgi:hypothetical protein